MSSVIQPTTKSAKHASRYALPDYLMGCGLILFIILKIPHLSLPFFWDETGVYGKIIFQLADQNLSLSPNAIDQWISRGHPLLYSNIIAMGCKLFGTTTTVAHGTNFMLAITLLVSMYVHLKKAFHAYVGVIACVTLMAMPMFFTQSVFIIPEVALALAIWWCTWGFIHKRFIVYMVAGSAAVMIKEPAIIWIVALVLTSFFYHRKPLIHNLVWLVPCMVFGIFLLIQKQQLGWYFFPYHAGGFDFKMDSITTKLGDCLEYLFWKQARYTWAAVLIIGGILAHKRLQSMHGTTAQYRRKYGAAVVPFMAYIAFCCTTFYHARYFIPALPVLCSVIAISAYYGIAREQRIPTLAITLVLILIGIPYNSSTVFNYDLDMSYTRSIKTSKRTIRYLVDEGMYHPEQVSATMPLLYAMNDPRFGYLPKDSLNGIHPRAINEKTRIAVQTEPGTMIENPDGFTLDTIEHWHQWGIKTTFYKVLPKDTLK